MDIRHQRRGEEIFCRLPIQRLLKPSLDVDMRDCQALFFGECRIRIEFLPNRAFDIRWMSVLALDMVGVVRVHCTQPRA